MPCYVMQTQEVKFSMKSLPYLIKALEAMKKENVNSRVKDGKKIHIFNGYQEVELDLETSQATFRGSSEGLLNRIKKQYTLTVVQEVAKKKRFAMTIKNNKIQLKKW